MTSDPATHPAICYDSKLFNAIADTPGWIAEHLSAIVVYHNHSEWCGKKKIHKPILILN